MPTWRKDIVLPKDQAKGVRPYNPKFKDSEYFARYNALINDERLIEFAKNNNYKITFSHIQTFSNRLRTLKSMSMWSLPTITAAIKCYLILLI